MSNAMRLKSREYKFMLDHLRFESADEAIADFWSEVRAVVKFIRVKANGTPVLSAKRKIAFFDTPDQSFRRNEFVFRRRQESDGAVQFTLKCRSPDRFIAVGAEVNAAKKMRSKHGAKEKKKLEEDIAAPFVSRFSRSSTLVFGSDAKPPRVTAPATIAECGLFFPRLRELVLNRRAIPADTPVVTVNGIEAYERVYEGGRFYFQLDDNSQPVEASAAMILWSLGKKGRPLVAEFSFRYKDHDQDGHFDRRTAQDAKRTFERLQKLDWSLENGTTKTQYVYGD